MNFINYILYNILFTAYPEERTEENCQQHEPSVPIVRIVDGCNTQEHEDDGF